MKDTNDALLRKRFEEFAKAYKYSIDTPLERARMHKAFLAFKEGWLCCEEEKAKAMVHSSAGCAMVDRSLRGKDSRMCLATVTGGEHVGETVGVMVQYPDGFCICDMGGRNSMTIIRVEHLRFWIPVWSLKVEVDKPVTHEPV